MAIERIDRGKNHSYKIDGRKADGVTTLIKGGLPAPALMYWSARTVAEYVADNVENVRGYMDTLNRDQLVKLLKDIPWGVRDKAAVNGTDVHNLAEKLVHGEEVEVPAHLTGYVDSCIRFFDEWRVKPVLVEAVVASRKWNHAGTLDLVADLPNGERWLLDHKTGASGIWPETVFQLAAYRYSEVYVKDGVEHPMSELGITGVAAVWIQPTGYQVIPLEADEAAYKAFLHVAYVARTSGEAKKRIGEPLTVPAWEAAA